jgi:hypothetical protein
VAERAESTLSMVESSSPKFPTGSFSRDASGSSQRASLQISRYADLLNQKIIVESSNTKYLAVEQHFLRACMLSSLRMIRLDEDWYLNMYPDVKTAIDRGDVESASEHYVRFGFYEHRLPYAIEVDESWYIQTYADVREAIARNNFESAREHFLLVGYKEGRLPYPDFRLDYKIRSQ